MQPTTFSILSRPEDQGAFASQVQILSALAYNYFAIVQLDRSLIAAIQSVNRRVATEQRSERNPELDMQLFRHYATQLCASDRTDSKAAANSSI